MEAMQPKGGGNHAVNPVVIEPKPAPAGLGGPGRAAATGGERRCGTCRVCCRLPEIPDLGKPLDALCPHANPDPLSEKGCGVFGSARRPSVCAQFRCGWLLGLGEEDDRPDRLGVLMQPTVRGEREPVLAFVEDRPGALNSPRAQALMGAWGMHINGPVVVRRAGAPNFLRVPLTIDRVVVRPGLAGRVGPPAAADAGAARPD